MPQTAERIEECVEILPVEVGHNLRHFRYRGLHLLDTTGEGECECQPEQIPHREG